MVTPFFENSSLSLSLIRLGTFISVHSPSLPTSKKMNRCNKSPFTLLLYLIFPTPTCRNQFGEAGKIIRNQFEFCPMLQRILKLKREEDISHAATKQRKCLKCKKPGHNSRNCDKFNLNVNPSDGASFSRVNTLIE
ncbi:hypothetical protein L1987_06572 [Smallanthus sonchifolius]|uniref:Uncharacterized protein n=1 Tax=Smallanthus sonchifolius TaxID=185202 RepID=A0ACB9JYI1_9ASTR|nr:hypothetical protein L1987_06572 [Smallanthus sonchifolius]